MSRFNFTNLLKRASTWIAAAMTAASTALGAYALFPGRLQALMPDWALVACGVVLFVGPFLIPIATSFQQKFKSKPPGTPPATT